MFETLSFIIAYSVSIRTVDVQSNESFRIESFAVRNCEENVYVHTCTFKIWMR